MLREPIALAARDHLGGANVVLIDKLDPAAIDAVLLDVDADRARRVRAELAASTSAIVPIVAWDATAKATGCASSSSAR